MLEKVKLPKIRKSASLVAIALLITIIPLIACTPSNPAPQFTLRIGWFSAPSLLPYFVMKEQGFDKKNGLQFLEQSYPGGAAIIEAISDGSLDIGVSGTAPPVLSAAERGIIPSKVIAVAANDFVDPDHPAVGVLVTSSVNSWQDLKGQIIAVNSLNSVNAATIVGRLQQEGVYDYKLIEIIFPNMGLAVAGGDVAAAAMAEPYIAQSVLRKDGNLLGWVAGGPPLERMELTMVIFSTDFYHNNPAAVKAFLRAQLQAAEWINQNPEGARNILARQLALSSEVAQEMELPYFSLDGHNDPALLENMQPLLIDIGMLKAPIPASQLYDETLLNEVLAEKR